MKNPIILCSRCYSTKLQLPKCNVKAPVYKGMSYEEMVSIRKRNLNPTLSTLYRKPLAFYKGSKQWLFDLDGNRYLDMFGGISTISVGHCHPKITKVLTEQSDTLGHVSNVYFHEKIHEYAKRLADTMPGNLKCVYFVNSGSEANDLALLMARAHTGKYDIFSLKNCYHGMTYQVMEMTSLSTYRFSVPGSPGIYKVSMIFLFRRK
ncbi:unnamed protein product [Acanthoscelides obtectus]|uniref:Alanine--glyoxylate aminotransferase 2, mitochondrial n=2 Tax=Acanthoscelides obtectus TaxID=200917 RepID=A0A9P0LIX7_ACAOB|nr:unnamed protein product [Acanthoscelides obtectus]CAK1635490.1 Alanine--glyoxylate aminotransferase 2, mitochondrial [Acanthoscelides obtectus]